jgi:hypothetical protein
MMQSAGVDASPCDPTVTDTDTDKDACHAALRALFVVLVLTLV